MRFVRGARGIRAVALRDANRAPRRRGDDGWKHDHRPGTAKVVGSGPVVRGPRLNVLDRAAAVKLAIRDPAGLGLDGLRWSGRQWMSRSPWRDERTASCSIRNMADGLAFYDFGIDRGGDVLNVIAALHGLATSGRDFAKLVEIGERLAGIVPGDASARRAARPTPPPDPDDTPERHAVQRAIHSVLLDVAPLGNEGVAYLRRRSFELGEIPEDWCLLPPPSEQQRVLDAIIGEIGRDAWREMSGLAFNGGSRFAHPDARLVIPWRSGSGVQAEVGLLQRRRLDGGTPKYIGPAGIRARMPFGIEDFEIDGDGTTLVIVEGALDVLAVRALARERDLEWWPLGIPGTGAWRTEWAALGAGRDVIVGLDADGAGNITTTNIMLDLEDAHARVTARAPSHGNDWNDTLTHLRSGNAGE